MFCGRKTIARFNHVHERALRIVHKNNSLCFEQPSKIHNSHNISDCNGTRTHIRLVRKRTLNHLAKLQVRKNI